MAVRELVAESLDLSHGVESPISLRIKKPRTPCERMLIKAMRPVALVHNWIDDFKQDAEREVAIASLVGIVVTTVANGGVPDLDSAVYGIHLMNSSERIMRRQYST